MRLFTAVGSRVFGGRTVAIAAELEDEAEGHVPCDPLRWHLVRSTEAVATGVFDAEESPLLKDYCLRKKDDELVTELVAMHGSSIDFDAAKGTAASTCFGEKPRVAPVTRRSSIPEPTELYDTLTALRESEESKSKLKKECSKLAAMNSKLARDNSKLADKNTKLKTTTRAKQTPPPKMSAGDVEKIAQAAKKGAMEGTKQTPATRHLLATPQPPLSHQAQDNTLMLTIVDKIREDNVFNSNNLVKVALYIGNT